MTLRLTMHGVRMLLIVLLLCVSVVESKTVVFLPFMITSHSRAHCKVAEALAKLGHDTWCGQSAAMETRRQDVFAGVHTFSFRDLVDFNEELITAKLEFTAMGVTTDGKPDLDWVSHFHKTAAEFSFRAIKDGKIVDFIRSLKPDLLVLDFYPRNNEFVALSYLLDVPFAVFSPLFDYSSSGVPFNPMAELYNSEYYRTQASVQEQLGMLTELMWPMFEDAFFDKSYCQHLLLEKPGVTTNDLMRKAEVFIIQSDPINDYPRPGLPNFKYVGGVTSTPARPLQEPFKSFVEESARSGAGLAIVSFGTLFMHFPENIEAKLINVLQQLKFHIIWRANITSPDPQRILTATWIPQNDLLGNKNTKVFLSHCGAHSQFESVYHAVPLVCIPLFFDQDYNTERIRQKGYGLGVNILTDSAEQIVNVVENVTNSPRIQSAVKMASEIFQILYRDPAGEAAFWLDHVMKYGGSYMRSSSQKMLMSQLFWPQSLVFLAGAACGLFLLLAVLCFRWIYIWGKQSTHLKKD